MEHTVSKTKNHTSDELQLEAEQGHETFLKIQPLTAPLWPQRQPYSIEP